MSALGISSPSRVFADIAIEIPRGMAQGIERGMSQAIRSASRMSQSVIDVSHQAVPTVADLAVSASRSATNSTSSTSSTTTTIEVNVNIENMNSEIDVHQLAHRVAQEIASRI